MQINSGSINSGAINGSAGDAPLPPNHMDFVEGISVTDSMATQPVSVFRESLVVDDSLSSVGTFVFDLEQTLQIVDKMTLGWSINFVENISFTGDIAIDQFIALNFIEQLVIEEGFSTRLSAMLALAEVIHYETTIGSGKAFDISENLQILGDSELSLRGVMNYLESLNINDDIELQARVFFDVTEDFNIEDMFTSQGTLVANFLENVNFTGVLDLPEGQFEAWVMNTETKAGWQYTNFPFNSFTKYLGSYYGVDESGLYELEGDKDDGENINAAIKTGLESFGTTQYKRIPRAYFGYTSSGQLLFKTVSTDTGKKIERWYELLVRQQADDVTNARVKLARGVKAVYWQFDITNVDGADFNIDEIKLMPTVLKRRR